MVGTKTSCEGLERLVEINSVISERFFHAHPKTFVESFGGVEGVCERIEVTSIEGELSEKK